ncbi:hypothetical protein A3A64_00650 [Candidatus Gottesmanbacteria bacterium RIFCSPLOWO2_01_FULL_48_11]|uniref:DUF1573 domain-containing protein n=3 Tax=Candidatus Gottesmaniibacteriota TaxID=1752720 RepID=A0A0G1UNK3_9BACT|nr:MAG: hypothetical protein UY27_C0011G0002 [Candidatus Gottesmanbacteria bacterium GW2011_GWA1_48_13]OGG28234.1 MAG: hypothetical protein A3A64_00650 [Candidatus Gottesmanbacteria bacterium RIFCSPLOWO2_01_FULL_48_11]
MKNDTKVILGALVASLAVIVGAVFLFGNDKSPKRDQLGAAGMAIDKTFEDFGSMTADEERTATFMISNTSDSPLRIWNIATSCDCTFASVVIDDVQTGEFNMTMHTSGSLKNWIGEVAAGKQATLKVTYRPKVMPVTGIVTRQVTFSTNDPKNETVEVSVKANVL